MPLIPPGAYEAVKWLHAGCAATTWLLFLIRGLWRFRDSPLIRRRWVRVTPHAVDTVLLGSALVLASQWIGVPAMRPFLVAKVCALVVYILLGMAAFRWAGTRRAQVTCWLAAQCVFVYIVGVAVTRSPDWGMMLLVRGG